MNKWNFKTKKYENFNSPAKRIVLFSDNMTLDIDCTNCGAPLLFGDAFTSRTIYTAAGLGYPVCSECYKKELILAKQN